MSKTKKKLSKTVLEMKFMKKTKIQQDKHDDETENIDLLTNQTARSGIHSNFVIERNWELIEKLRSSRINYGMSKKQSDKSGTKKKSHPNTERDIGNEKREEEDDEDYEPKAKHIRYNSDEDEDNY